MTESRICHASLYAARIHRGGGEKRNREILSVENTAPVQLTGIGPEPLVRWNPQTLFLKKNPPKGEANGGGQKEQPIPKEG